MRLSIKLPVQALVKPLTMVFLLAVILPPASGALAVGSGGAMTHMMDQTNILAGCQDASRHAQPPCSDCSTCAGACAAALGTDPGHMDIRSRTRPFQSFKRLRDDAPTAVDTRPPI